MPKEVRYEQANGKLDCYCMFLLAGCGASGPKLASSIEDIAGTWRSTVSSIEWQLNEDGTASSSAGGKGEYRFEGTRFIGIATPGSVCALEGHETGIYEVELLENGNLKFTVIEDECLARVNIVAGRLVEVEWEPVP